MGLPPVPTFTVASKAATGSATLQVPVASQLMYRVAGLPLIGRSAPPSRVASTVMMPRW